MAINHVRPQQQNCNIKNANSATFNESAATKLRKGSAQQAPAYTSHATSEAVSLPLRTSQREKHASPAKTMNTSFLSFFDVPGARAATSRARVHLFVVDVSKSWRMQSSRGAQPASGTWVTRIDLPHSVFLDPSASWDS